MLQVWCLYAKWLPAQAPHSPLGMPPLGMPPAMPPPTLHGMAHSAPPGPPAGQAPHSPLEEAPHSPIEPAPPEVPESSVIQV